MKSYYITDTGKVRTHNEDSVMIVKNLSGEYLMVVADGMGGHKAGEVASSIVVNGLTDKFKVMETIGEKQDAVNWIRKNANELNEAIFKYTDEFEESTVISRFSTKFEAGKSYKVTIKVYGLEKVEITAALQAWEDGGSTTIDPDDPPTGNDDAPEPEPEPGA